MSKKNKKWLAVGVAILLLNICNIWFSSLWFSSRDGNFMILDVSSSPLVCKNGDLFFDKCFCNPGYGGSLCDRQLECAQDDFKCMYSESGGVAKVPATKWEAASKAELARWVSQKQTFHDRSDEHEQAFDGYRALKEIGHLGAMLEIGCGPYTQTAWILEKTQLPVSSVTLVDPNVLNYANGVEHCAYKSGRLLNHKTNLFAAGGEDARFDQVYDTVVMINVIKHCVNAFEVLQNLHTALKPGGILVFHERWWDGVLDNGQSFDANKPDSLGRQKHPVRLNHRLIEYLISQFDVLYRNDDTDAMKRRKDTGTYVILRKKFEDFRNSNQLGTQLQLSRGGFTLVVLSGYAHRQENVQKIIDLMSTSKYLMRIVILFQTTGGPRVKSSNKVTLKRPKENTLLNRYNDTILELTTDCVLYLDDDFAMPGEDADAMFELWRTMPDRLMGVWQKMSSKNSTGDWIYHSTGDPKRYNFVLPGAAGMVHTQFLHTYLSPKYFELVEYYKELQECDDIFLNLIVARETGKPPIRVKGVRLTQLQEGKGLHSSGGGARSLQRGACIGWFADKYNHEPLTTTAWLQVQ